MMKEIFNGIFKDSKDIYTNDLIEKKQRLWDPTRSKLAAAILNGLHEEIKEKSVVLYLGAATGTTVSHVSDIVGSGGFIYALDFADRVFQQLIDVSKKRKNIMPLLADARKPEAYRFVEECGIVYCDIAQPDQTDVAIRNCKEFLKQGGCLFLAIKSQSIDVTKKPEKVYEEEKNKLEKSGFDVLELIDLEPYEDKHAMIIARKK
jgi:fibrillarin-like pre-rRNA processing protein